MTGAPEPHRFDDLDAAVALIIQLEEDLAPLRGVDAIAVEAIVALSHAGMDLMTEASHAGPRDVERLSQRARAQLDAARDLIGRFSVARNEAR